MTAAGRLRLLQAVTLAAFAVLLAQLVRMQLIDAPRGPGGGSEQRMRVLMVEPPRGLIFDRNGAPLARNVPQFSVAVIPGDLPRDDDLRRTVLRAIERETGVPYAQIERNVIRGLDSVDPFSPVTLRAGLDGDAAIAMRAALADVPGVRVEAAPVRRYEGGELLAHVLGFVAPISPEDVDGYLDEGYPLNARVGRSGVEFQYEAELRGRPGRRLIAADPAGRELETLGEVAAGSGADLVLSIDLDLQAAAARALEAGIAAGLRAANDAYEASEPRAAAGAAVVVDVRSGELLALVSAPSYDANVFAGAADAETLDRVLTDPARPLVHRAYMEVRSPGSIFKPIAAAAALQEGVATPETRITSTGAIVVRDEFDPTVRYVFRDWAAHGTLDLYGGIARSSDVYFYYLSGGYVLNGERVFEGLGAERLATYSRGAGLGAPTGIDLPGEAAGLVPDARWKSEAVAEPWVLGDTYTFGIGQGYLTVTPLQMAIAAAAIANGGDVLTPRVVRALREDGARRPTERVVAARLPVDGEHLAVVREAMRQAAAPGGTAARGQPPGMTIGGKTGTAEFGPAHADGSFDTHAWYLGFAPYEAPEVAVVVYIEHGVGAIDAAPVARAIFESYFAGRPSVSPPTAEAR